MERLFEITGKADGALTLSLTWDPSRGAIELWLDDRGVQGNPPGRIASTLPIVRGQRYLLRVADAAPWDYDDLHLPFVLTTAFSR
jgi:hypothetical protein